MVSISTRTVPVIGILCRNDLFLIKTGCYKSWLVTGCYLFGIPLFSGGYFVASLVVLQEI